MKRLIIVLPIVALSCVFLLHMNANRANPFSLGVASKAPETISVSITKYEDCIQKESLITIKAFLKRENRLPVGKNLSKLDGQIRKYQTSLDSTIHNLNAIDAHSFLHDEFRRCKELILSSESSSFLTYYHLKIMEACYEKDKMLNESSQNSLANL
ncbi:hypothetical protein [Flagellimonas meridianipacifica]|uniref:Uncharacterized protein n=1 Tax=Flagellimonas meridianipacifica TaxID=1080225 RepID=A0A2T0M8H9_9FLAO|nr:hypothetical protein [Allomuricauda pacifica]PRX53732.1 hypothetical protein CLV81_2119 [Allomuricauda pacifica]